jgi:Acyl-CoA dehydrogenase, middle domain/Electron transfer flavoprotein FAD-binding domain/Acyl-CoA dehydrogenase, N-terminal domain
MKRSQVGFRLGPDAEILSARGREGGLLMSWDFSTEPEFERKLEWMRAFVREEAWPIETIFEETDQEQLDRIYAPIQAEVKRQRLWAAHLSPELGGRGFGQVKLGLMQEILGSSPFAPHAFGCQAPDSGNSEILALAGTPEQKARWLEPLLAGEMKSALKSAFSMTEPDTPGSDPTQLRTRAVREGDSWMIIGRKWYSSNASISDFLIVMAVTDPDAPPYRRASMFIVPADAPGVNIARDVPTMAHPFESFGRFGGHSEVFSLRGLLRGGMNSLRRPARRRGRRLRHRATSRRPIAALGSPAGSTPPSPLSRARVVVAGRRGLKDARNFAGLDELAKTIGNAAVGASRPGVDAGWVPFLC